MMRKQAGKDVPFPVGLNTLIKMHSKKRGENIFKEDMKEQVNGPISNRAIVRLLQGDLWREKDLQASVCARFAHGLHHRWSISNKPTPQH